MLNKELASQIDIKVAFSSSCNLKCVYCEGLSGFTQSKYAAMEDYRRSPLNTGGLSTDELLKILGEIHRCGIIGMSATGGEPLLRTDWDTVVNESRKIGYQRISITTNGLLLEDYLNRHGQLPEGLNLIKLSIDTHDPEKYRKITGGGSLAKLVCGVKAINGQVYVRANKVLLRSDIVELPSFIDFCRSLDLREISFLDLVYYSNRGNLHDKEYFEDEFVGFPEFNQYIKDLFHVSFNPSGRPGGVQFFETYLPDGMKISFKDSRITLRDSLCQQCPVFCQEGRCLIRLATDGNITACPDYQRELPYWDGRQLLRNKGLVSAIDDIINVFTSSSKERTIETFAQKQQLRLPKII